jgi:hypothetical protein
MPIRIPGVGKRGGAERRYDRGYACGMIALSPDRDGRIAGFEGGEEIWRRFGECIVPHHFPPPGTPTQPIEAGYMANDWMRMRHPDYDELRRVAEL